ncbi:MAG TPA: EpsI family protein [Bryobacteraceae bacterium]|jgi:EpsI family protein|nr:EpsI family protein [Bryobacteraceae bacterium]
MNSVLRSKYFRVLTVVLIVQAALFYTASRGEGTPLVRPLSDMPLALGNWVMTSQGVVDEETEAVLRADDTVIRSYKGPDGTGASLFIAYFKTQRAGAAPHSPKNCLPGAGFQPVESGYIDVPVSGKTININRYVVSNGDIEDVVLYWYQSQGRVIAGEFAAKFYLIADSIRRHRSDTSLVRVVVQAAPGMRDQATQAGVNFVQAAYPVVSTWIPQ